MKKTIKNIWHGTRANIAKVINSPRTHAAAHTTYEIGVAAAQVAVFLFMYSCFREGLGAKVNRAVARIH